MQLVPCPDGGKCGNQKHRPNSHRYKWCLHMAQMRQRSRDTKARILAQGGTNTQSLSDYTKMVDGMRKEIDSVAYAAANDYVTTDMVIPEEFVQAYINNPDDTNDMLREKLKGDIRDDMLNKDRDILFKLGMGIDYFSDDEIDTVIDAVLEADRSNIAGAMAKNMGPRTFTHHCYPTKNGSRAAFDKAMHEYEVGSDEWYDALADGYHRDLKDNHLSYPGRAGMGGSQGDEDRQAIASALKQAIGYDLNEIDDDYYDELPGIEVVWTGDLSDVGPNDDSGLQEKLHIWQPHFIFSHPTGEVVSDPVRLHGQYVIDLPSREDRYNGAESRILDDMSSRRTRRFDYPDGVGLSQYSAADVYRTFE